MLSKIPINLFTALIIFNFLSAQEYDVNIWGFNVGYAEITHTSENDITLTLNIDELIENIYPLSIELSSKYDKHNFKVIESNKKAEQGREKYKYSVNYSNGKAIYDDEDSFELNRNTYSFLSLLEKIIYSPIDSIDTKWFNLENEGIVYKARPLWNDTSTVNIDNDKFLCDHYRIDLKVLNDDNKIFDQTDYFNELFFDINSIRQLWVETWQKQRRLVKISIKNNLINLNLTIKK